MTDEFDRMSRQMARDFDQIVNSGWFNDVPSSSLLKEGTNISPRSRASDDERSLTTTNRELSPTRGRDNQMSLYRSGGMAPQMKLDVIERKDRYSIQAELAGMPKENVKVNVREGLITISGETGDSNEVNESDPSNQWRYHRVERHSGSVSRSLRLPPDVDANGAKARFDNGLLTVDLPKREHETAPIRQLRIE